MVATAKTIAIDPESETARLLDEADLAPIVLEVRGTRYVVQREAAEQPENHTVSSENELGPEWDEYDPAEVIQVLDEMSGKWAERDLDRMIEEIYRARLEGSRQVDRPGPL
jgi:hypothetical protein